ncbi:MAG TPA: DUF4124 domain-containing protein [Nitrospiraceae bacterium]|nr:DUF4124 domain-containing protein [Nitrospiraceae bacterium]
MLVSGLVPGTLAHGDTAEVYSWVDSTGAVVMTDDPGRIPPATQRHSLSIHRFDTSTAASDQSMERGNRSEERNAPDPQEIRHDPAESVPITRGNDDASASDVVLKMTDDLDRDSYVWMPFQTPLAVGSDVVGGFWWHPGVTSPVDAFKAYLRRHHRPVPKESWLSTVLQSGRPRTTQEMSSGNSVYDQVVGERQLLIHRNGLLFGSPLVPQPKDTPQRPDPGLKAPR